MTANVLLANGETATKAFGVLNPYKPADSVPELRWQVRYNAAAPKERAAEFHFQVRSTNLLGLTDTSDVYCQVELPHNLLDVERDASDKEFSLECYPAPFNAQAQIAFTLLRSSDVTLEVFDAFGRFVRTIVKERFTNGAHTMTFLPGKLPSGVYFIRLKIPGKALMKEMLFVR
jgi:hypothetical protein